MGTWVGWYDDLRRAVGAPATALNHKFFASWQSYSPPACRNNPIAASRKMPGSTDCYQLSDTRWAQNYTSPNQGINATAAQIKSGNFDNILHAVRTGNPYAADLAAGVSLDLQKWGSEKWHNIYMDETGLSGSGSTGSGSPGAARNRHAMGAWTRWMHALAHTGPASHRRLVKATRRANRIARHR